MAVSMAARSFGLAQAINSANCARTQRGHGRVFVERIPYVVDQAVRVLSGLRHIVLVGAKMPVAFFAYPGLPSELTPPGCTPLVLAQPHEDGPAALEALADLIGAKAAALPTNRLEPSARPCLLVTMNSPPNTSVPPV